MQCPITSCLGLDCFRLNINKSPIVFPKARASGILFENSRLLNEYCSAPAAVQVPLGYVLSATPVMPFVAFFKAPAPAGEFVSEKQVRH